MAAAFNPIGRSIPELGRHPGWGIRCNRAFPSGRAANVFAVMWIAHILCSGPECFEELEVVVESLDELNGFVCECGLGFELHAVSDAVLTG